MASENSCPYTSEGVQAADTVEWRDATRIVLLGWRWPGKSLAGNTILGREMFCSERASEFCVMRQAKVAERQVKVVDTPGWYSEQVTPKHFKQEIVHSVSLCSPGPHAFLLVVPVGLFTKSDLIKVEEHINLLSDRAWKNMIVLFTWGNILKDRTIEQHIQREGKELQWLVEKCGNRYHVLNIESITELPQVMKLLEKIDTMVEREGLYHSDIDEKELHDMKDEGWIPNIVVPEEESDDFKKQVMTRKEIESLDLPLKSTGERPCQRNADQP
ncbi:GTPase IMAP family member 4 isoform X2 [Amia ocellicauda]|uniref:GTPase IMAP family member 4 isoform X2 n=1 Tax=Amia ocellicauda TaxID=2972642 RepID=UPI003464E14C